MGCSCEILLKFGDNFLICRSLFQSANVRAVFLLTTCLLIWPCLNIMLTAIYMEHQEIDGYMQQNFDDKLDQVKYYKDPEDEKFSINRPFIISNNDLCKDTNPYLIIVVPSRTGNFLERNAIRETYGSMSRDKIWHMNSLYIEHIVRVVFIVGTADNVTLQNQILKEYAQFRDTVQIDIKDTYYNLCLKMLYGFKWINSYCNGVTYVLKSDDDTFVHIGILIKQLNNVKRHPNGNVYGRIYNKTKQLRVRTDNGKWNVRDSEYPLRKYPPYAQGSSYTLTFDLIPRIIKRAVYLPYLHNEDVFLTGILAGKIFGAELVRLNKTSDWTDRIPNPCGFAIKGRLAESNMTPDLMYKTWKAISAPAHECDVLNYPDIPEK